MPATNPYRETDNAPWWDAGYGEAICHPPDIPTPPMVLQPETATIWSEGALAGNTDGRAEGWCVHLDVDRGGLKPEGPELELAGGHLAAEVVLHVAQKFLKVRAGGLLPVTALLVILDLETFDPTDDQVINLAGNALARYCQEQNCGELFLPTCVSKGHALSGDPLLDAGYWHGKAYMDDWDAAFKEADAHATDQPDHVVGVIRWSSTNTNRYLWDWVRRSS
jgi:hypothetical protein